MGQRDRRRKTARKQQRRFRHEQQKQAERAYGEASRLVISGQYANGIARYHELAKSTLDRRLRALVANDLAALAACDGDSKSAICGFRRALAIDPACEPARLNLALVEADLEVEEPEVCTERRLTSQPAATSETRESQSNLTIESDQENDIGQSPSCLLLMITFNRLEYTKLALEALLKLDYPRLRILIWDNASSDGTASYLKDRLKSVAHVTLELSNENRGVVYPMNAVWGSDSSVELLAKVDNDTLVPADLLRRLTDCHVRSRHFGALSGFHFRNEGEALAEETKVVNVNGARVFRQRFVGGCAVMMRRAVFEELGPIPSSRQLPALNGPLAGRPFMDGGWTSYQQRLDELGYINGYPWPLVHVDHMEDTRSPHCIRSTEHEQYKQALRGMSLDEFTQELCVWRPH